MDFRIVVHRACESHAMDCPTGFRGIKSVGLCAGDEIRTRNTCLEGKGDDLFTTPAIGGDGLCLRAGKHYMQRKNVYDRSKLFGTEGSQPQPIPQRSRRDSNPRTV